MAKVVETKRRLAISMASTAYEVFKPPEEPPVEDPKPESARPESKSAPKKRGRPTKLDIKLRNHSGLITLERVTSSLLPQGEGMNNEDIILGSDEELEAAMPADLDLDPTGGLFGAITDEGLPAVDDH